MNIDNFFLCLIVFIVFLLLVYIFLVFLKDKIETKLREAWCDAQDERLLWIDKHPGIIKEKNSHYKKLVQKDITAYKKFKKFGDFFDPKNDNYINSLEKQLTQETIQKEKRKIDVY